MNRLIDRYIESERSIELDIDRDIHRWLYIYKQIAVGREIKKIGWQKDRNKAKNTRLGTPHACLTTIKK